MVAAGLGVSIVPARCVREMNPMPVKPLSLGPDGPVRRLSLVWREDNPRPRMVDAVGTALETAVSIGAFSPPDTKG
jgi:DNA-binding transcriptional LysR family regulator